MMPHKLRHLNRVAQSSMELTMDDGATVTRQVISRTGWLLTNAGAATGAVDTAAAASLVSAPSPPCSSSSCSCSSPSSSPFFFFFFSFFSLFGSCHAWKSVWSL